MQKQHLFNDYNIDYDSRRSFPFGLSPIPEVPSELASEISSYRSSSSENETPRECREFKQDPLYSGSLSSVKNDKTDLEESDTLLSSDERTTKDLLFHIQEMSSEDENSAKFTLYLNNPIRQRRTQNKESSRRLNEFEDILSDLSTKAIDLKRDLIQQHSTLSSISSMESSRNETDEEDFRSCNLDNYNADHSDNEPVSTHRLEMDFGSRIDEINYPRRRRRKRRKRQSRKDEQSLDHFEIIHNLSGASTSEESNLRHSRLFKLIQDVSMEDDHSFVGHHDWTSQVEDSDSLSLSLEQNEKDEDFRYRGWKNVWSYLYKEGQRNSCQNNTESSVDDHSLKIEMELQELEKFPSTPGIDFIILNN